jgi:purine-binding chemotaxis protein CheW
MDSLEHGTPGPTDHDSEPTAVQLLTFEVGGETLAIDILAVQAINRLIELTRVPQSPAHVVGVITLRGATIPVVDLGARCALKSGGHADHARIIIVDVDARMLGLIVDRVHGALCVGDECIAPTRDSAGPIDPTLIAGVCTVDDRRLTILDLEPLLGDERPRATEGLQAAA